MFIVRIELRLRDQQRIEFRRVAGAIGPTARGLAGCVEYCFCEDVVDPTRALLYEEWTSRDAFEAYKASTAFEQAGAGLRPLLAEPPRSAYYESNNLFGLRAVP